MPEYLFIYGTLEPSMAKPEIITAVGRLTFIGEATTRGALFDLGDFPGAILGGEDVIHGRLYELPDDETTLAELDDFEDYDPLNPDESLYLRTEIAAELGGETVDAWIYEYNRPVFGHKQIENGDYFAYKTL